MGTFENLEKAVGAFERAGMRDKALQSLMALYAEDRARAYPVVRRWRGIWNAEVKALATKSAADAVRTLYFMTARDYFDDYLIAVEYDKPYKDKYYLPRRKYLMGLGLIDAYQKALDGELDFLSISMPKRTGKSETGINFICMLSGRNPALESMVITTGDALVGSFFNECRRYFDPNNGYNYLDIFPQATMVGTNADERWIDLKEPHRFHTILCRSVNAAQIGLSEATNVLYLDDLVESREEAKNAQRMENKWEYINGDVLGRALEGTPIISCGTRYSVNDPMGRLQEKAKDLGWRTKIIEVPALSDKDESNYEFFNPKLGRQQFTAQYFMHERQSLSPEQWESEFQQQPFEARGILFPREKLQRFTELPLEEPDYVYAVCDTAESGEDSCVMLVAYVYGEDIFIPDVVYDNSTPNVTKAECAKMIAKHGVGTALFESNNAGEYFARDVEQMLKTMGVRCSIKTKRTSSNKQTKIELASDNILKYFHFLDDSKITGGGQYSLGLRELFGYTRTGKVAHDDFPDACAMLENALRGATVVNAQILKRPF
ncbi:MAG: hypothetical protein LUD47_06830 [Clostridia bacterium]|nr:hypothetical protein [Clostridia bacterium]